MVGEKRDRYSTDSHSGVVPVGTRVGSSQPGADKYANVFHFKRWYDFRADAAGNIQVS